ncbi:uncharacterized protein LOC129707614 [Leucoraja erinacea]|uniref:uncharacterized protein LOC129707614 n=1 Tax=Leucoraja erinaceus TaxID=7782 RepID=UPI002457C0C4|nr:uncharacterized protein LOC129707614 [Leucoraja erinacea]
MTVRAVYCSGCQMWEVMVSDGPPDFHICTRCIEMGLLRDRIRILEQQFDDLCLVRESEEVIERSYREVVTPKPWERDMWITLRKGKGQRQGRVSTPMSVHLANKYSCLSTDGGDSLPGGSDSGRASSTETGPVAPKGRDKKKRAIEIGDSIVRGSDRRFCGRSRETRMVVCLPGAKVSDVSQRIQDIQKSEGEEPEVVVHIGTNDIGKKREEVLKGGFRELGGELRKRTKKVTISGLLPVPRDSESRNGARWRINAWLKDWCRGQGFKFLDHWDFFWGRWDLYRKDGLHLNPRETNILAGKFAKATGETLN